MAEDLIKHIVVLMFENRSFDHILGGTQKMRGRYDLSGFNDYKGNRYGQMPGAARQVPNDPVHETKDVLVQLGANGAVPANGGFVLSYAHQYPQLADPSEVMRFHDEGTLPAIHALANSFTICERWHSSVPGPTWVNRLFALSGTSLGRVKMPNGIMNLNLHWYDQPTIFDRLNEKSIEWRVYFGDTPLSLLFVHQWSPENAARHHHMMAFYQDAAGDADEFPAFAFIEPAYLQPGANDAHPPHDIIGSDVLVASVYNAIRANTELWNSTLLLVLFDEHGGFYDHVPPPAAIAPDHHDEEYDFKRYGVRVPALLVSPYVGNGVFSDLLDHTSLLKYAQDKWGLNDLGERTASANTFKGAFNFAVAPRTDTPLRIASTTKSAAPPAVAVDALNEHQSAIVAMSHNLESMTDEDANLVAARSRHLLTGPQSQIDAAVERVDNFVSQQKAEVESWLKMNSDLDGQLRLHKRMRAAAVGGFEGVSDTFYPGTRAPVPPIYSFALRAFLGDAIARTFDLAGSRVTGELSHFSLVTTPPLRLSGPQRMPHFDSTNPKQLAVSRRRPAKRCANSSKKRSTSSPSEKPFGRRGAWQATPTAEHAEDADRHRRSRQNRARPTHPVNRCKRRIRIGGDRESAPFARRRTELH